MDQLEGEKREREEQLFTLRESIFDILGRSMSPSLTS
jgi:hypothetical protein